ncbi:hypothetical protein [Kamptonema sp. UHCC 0994]|uniref:hypothetical protein n=1 Tax=Kamptonema sp. UHCC 0994 TaxID=3031329 RepID=UPI0023B9AD5E|nr:hypothetical protein [Kamptonema sp. UHCC 0994]MDF0551570.1 hypothetical protein [Kamptonema sp. UHCC 0994]
MNSPNESSETETAALIAELRQNGIKHNPQNIIRIAKTAEGKIIFLETGNATSGLQHILKDHLSQFADRGISTDQIPDVIMMAVTQGQIVGSQGKTSSTPRSIYQFTLNGETKYLAVQVSENGYIVSANPRTSIKFTEDNYGSRNN